MNEPDSLPPAVSFPEGIMLKLIQEVAEIACITMQYGASCVDRGRAYQDMCPMCKAKTLLTFPMIRRILNPGAQDESSHDEQPTT